MTDATDATSGVPEGDALTAAEQAYMESGGENAEALIAENAASAGDGAENAAQGASAEAGSTKPDPKSDIAHATDDVAADLAASDPQRPAPQRVSYHKFKRTEDRAKAAERELSDMREKFARGDERLRLLAEAMTQSQSQAQDLPPDPEQDIFAFVRWQARQMDRLGQELRNTRGEIGATRDTITQRHAADALRETYQRDAVAFAQKAPDFVQAYNHMLNTRAAILADQGYEADAIRAMLVNEERAVVQRALAANKSPAETIYGIAQRLGYVGSGAAPARGGKPSAGELLRNVQAGQAASKTLSASGGAAADLSVEALVNMSEQDFNALLRARPHQVEALMGRRS